MKVFLDFEASSLSNRSYPVEVAWVFEDGQSESHLIAPAPGWNDWDDAAQAIHGIERAMLRENGVSHEVVAARMIAALDGHDLFASAPSWDGKWLSALLRAAGLPRHALRLRDTDEALRETAMEILRPAVPPARLDIEANLIVAQASTGRARPPAHRALPDAQDEYAMWVRARQAAGTMTEAPWMAAACRAATRLRASTVGSKGARHCVYVVLLHDPRVPERWGLYVGQSSRDPDWRFDQHKAGYKASGAVRRFGVRLLPDLYEHLNRLQHWESLELEAALAESLREAGVPWVEGGH